MTFLTDILAPETQPWWRFATQMVVADLAIAVVILIGHGWYRRIERQTAAQHQKASIEASVDPAGRRRNVPL
jgi:hypothetical protein